jgi:hypothetical protein
MMGVEDFDLEASCLAAASDYSSQYAQKAKQTTQTRTNVRPGNCTLCHEQRKSVVTRNGCDKALGSLSSMVQDFCTVQCQKQRMRHTACEALCAAKLRTSNAASSLTLARTRASSSGLTVMAESEAIALVGVVDGGAASAASVA